MNNIFELSKLKDQNGIGDILKQIVNITEEVPFGNSDFQNKTTIVNGELSPHRAYRHASLRIINRLNALNECYYSMKENEVKIERLTREIKDLEEEKPKNYDLDIRMKQIEIDRIQSNYPYTEKLIKDAIVEIQGLAPVIEKIGKLDRKTFESMEKEHFKNVHNISLNHNEHAKGLLNIESNLFEDITQNNILKGEKILGINE